MNYPNFRIVMEIIENVFTKSFQLLYFVTAEYLGQTATDVVSGSTEYARAYLKILLRNIR